MANLKIENLIKKYENVRALDNFSIDIKSGEFMVILGPSGCGKTTALRCIAGLTSSTSGDIYIENQRVNNFPPKDRDIAMVFQNYALYPHLSVHDNIAFPLKMRKTPKSIINNKVKDIAILLGITDLLNRKPKELSGGQMQRVALGRALIREPKVFLMDEPLSNLDTKLRNHMRTEIKKLQKKIKITTLYITHDQTEAMSMADRIAIMDKGKVQQIGTPAEVYNTPNNTFVGQFIGNPPMNFINATIKETSLYLFSPPLKFEIQSQMAKQKILPPNFLIGIRPRDISIVKEYERKPEVVFKGIVNVSEMLGDELNLEIEVGQTTLKIATSDMNLSISVDETLEMGFDYNKIHYFDSESGNRIVL